MSNVKANQLTSRGREFQFDRRGYGNGLTYTWAYVKYQNEWLSLGDPWPVYNPSRKELHQMASYMMRYTDLKAQGLDHDTASKTAAQEFPMLVGGAL